MFYILLSKSILSFFFALNVLLEAWVFLKEFHGYYFNKHTAFIPFWSGAKYIKIT